jgi:hypothetical protein
VVAQGTPEDIAECERSHTGRYLRPLLSLCHASFVLSDASVAAS